MSPNMPNWKEAINEERRKAEEAERQRNTSKPPIIPIEKPTHPRIIELQRQVPGVMDRLHTREFLETIKSEFCPTTRLISGTYGYVLESLSAVDAHYKVYPQGGSWESEGDDFTLKPYRYRNCLAISLKLHNDASANLNWHYTDDFFGCCLEVLTMQIRENPENVYEGSPVDHPYHSNLAPWDGTCVTIPDFSELPEEKINAKFRSIIQRLQRLGFCRNCDFRLLFEGCKLGLTDNYKTHGVYDPLEKGDCFQAMVNRNTGNMTKEGFTPKYPISSQKPPELPWYKAWFKKIG